MTKTKDTYAAILGRKGGFVAAAKMTAEQRHDRAVKAAKGRWTKQKNTEPLDVKDKIP